MKRDVRILPLADADIEECFYYLQERTDLENAFRFIDALKAAFVLLCEMPEIGSPKRFNNPRLQDLRMWRVKEFEKYLIFYRVFDDQITVLRVLHSSRNITYILEGEE